MHTFIQQSFCFLLLLFGCKDQPPEELSFLKVETTQVSFSSEKNFRIIPCSSHTTIEAITSQPGWCTAEVVTFKNGNAIEVSVLENTAAGKERTATITVTSGRAKVIYIEVKQAPIVPVFTVDAGSVLEFNALADQQQITVTANVPFRAVSSDPSWCKVEIDSEATSGNATVSVTTNGTKKERTAEIIFISYGFDDVAISVHQSGSSFTIQDINAWVDCPASDFIVKFSGVEMPLSYRYDNTKITVDASKRTVTALTEGTFTVTASAGTNLTATFNVVCSSVNKADVLFTSIPNISYEAVYKAKWASDGGGNNSTLFIGDSFFNPYNHWTNFYTVAYTGYDAFCFGLSSSTSYNWEILESTFVTPLNPKNIVIHIGSNNFHHQKKSASETNNALQRLFTLFHGKLPNIKIYWFGIPLRADTTNKEATNQTNEAMQKWCDDREWITYIDTPSQIITSMYKDGAHLKLENYSILINALKATDIVIVKK